MMPKFPPLLPVAEAKQRASRVLLALLTAFCAGALPVASTAAPIADPQAPASSTQPATAAVAQSASAGAANAPAITPQPQPPSDLYGQLYRDVELAQVFADSKTFADMLPNQPPAQIVAAYENFQKENAKTTDPAARKAALTQFVNRYFSPPTHAEDNYVSDPNQDVVAHIDTLWNVLLRQPDSNANPYSSLLPLPRPYVVPGGRFDEIYYWDTWFIMLGLETSGRSDLARDALANFSSLIDRYGHIPNGNRSYYLSRSQPPFFAQMVSLVAQHDGDAVYLKYLPQLQKEYAYWMEGSDGLKPGDAARHVVRLADGTLMNRYWDERGTPRDESYREDVLTSQAMPQREPADLWRNLRAGAETGWDYSSRWFADNRTLATIDVTSLVPVDLNCLMVGLERTLAKAYGIKGDARAAAQMNARAQRRVAAIDRVLWDPQLHAFSDYDFADHALTHRLTAATMYPLFLGVATRTEAKQVAESARKGLLRPGGLATTQTSTGQQWDEPNGWAPLQYIAVVGLRRYGEPTFARTIATRWIDTNLVYYQRTHKLVEKYDVSAAAAKASSAGGGEYPLQDGFGWTNGVLRALLVMYPQTMPAVHAKH